MVLTWLIHTLFETSIIFVHAASIWDGKLAHTKQRKKTRILSEEKQNTKHVADISIFTLANITSHRKPSPERKKKTQNKSLSFEWKPKTCFLLLPVCENRDVCSSLAALQILEMETPNAKTKYHNFDSLSSCFIGIVCANASSYCAQVDTNVRAFVTLCLARFLHLAGLM